MSKQNQREDQIKAELLRAVANHSMQIINDDKEHRFLRFSNNGSSNYHSTS